MKPKDLKDQLKNFKENSDLFKQAQKIQDTLKKLGEGDILKQAQESANAFKQTGAANILRQARENILFTPPKIPDFKMPKITPVSEHMWDVYSQQQRDLIFFELKRQKNETEGQLVLLSSEIVTIEESLKGYKLPWTLYANLICLVYLSIVGVLAPLAILPIVSDFSLVTSYSLVGLFGLGLLAFFVFVGIELKTLRK